MLLLSLMDLFTLKMIKKRKKNRNICSQKSAKIFTVPVVMQKGGKDECMGYLTEWKRWYTLLENIYLNC